MYVIDKNPVKFIPDTSEHELHNKIIILTVEIKPEYVHLAYEKWIALLSTCTSRRVGAVWIGARPFDENIIEWSIGYDYQTKLSLIEFLTHTWLEMENMYRLKICICNNTDDVTSLLSSFGTCDKLVTHILKVHKEQKIVVGL